MRHTTSVSALSNALNRVCLSPTLANTATRSLSRPSGLRIASHVRTLATTPARMGSWLEPDLDRTKKKMKGRVRVRTGGSMKGTTVKFGDYGLRLDDFPQRIPSKTLKLAEDTIKTRLRGEKYRLYKRVNANIGVFTSGNEQRMGKGKGSFDFWAARVSLNRVVFEIKGLLHEKVIRDALRLAGNKLPGHYTIIKKGDPPCVGKTKLDGVTLDELRKPKRREKYKPCAHQQMITE